MNFVPLQILASFVLMFTALLLLTICSDEAKKSDALGWIIGTAGVSLLLTAAIWCGVFLWRTL